MEARIFGKELTNLVGGDLHLKKTYSQIHGEKVKDHSLHLVKAVSHNQSQAPKETKQEPWTPQNDQKDPQVVPEYFLDNLAFLRQQEDKTHTMDNYISRHTTVSENERAKLIDWLCKLHYKYKMFP